MITPRIDVSTSDIRTTVRTHLDELIREMQEVRINTTKLQYPLYGVILGYQQAPSATSGDLLTLVIPDEQKHVTIELDHITRFEVLPTRLMTPRHAYKQMKEMERIVGL